MQLHCFFTLILLIQMSVFFNIPNYTQNFPLKTQLFYGLSRFVSEYTLLAICNRLTTSNDYVVNNKQQQNINRT